MRDEALNRKYQELDQAIVRFSRKIRSTHEFEEVLFAPTPANKEAILGEFEDLKKQVAEIEAPDGVYEILKSHYGDFLSGMEASVYGMYENPAAGLLGCHWGLDNYLRTDARPVKVRQEQLIKKCLQLQSVWTIVKPFMKDVDQKKLNGFAGGLAAAISDINDIIVDVPEGLEGLAPGEIAKAQKALSDLAETFRNAQSYVREELISGAVEVTEAIPDTERIVKLEEKEYRSILKDKLGVELDELLAWHEEEMNKTRQECLDIAAAIDVPDPDPVNVGQVNDLLWKYAGPCDSPEEMYQRADLYLKRTRALAHEFVWMPSDESCKCVTLPTMLKVSYPWGGYEGGDQSRRPIAGQMFLNQFNYKEITDGWIKMNAMHETYPGHHVQYVRAITDTIPETLKIGAKHIPLIEGVAHRTERAFEWIFGEDPFFPLFVAYRRHHTSVRIKADLMLFYYGNTVEEATKLYMDELGFAHDIARGQVQSQMNTPGYFVCYYYGMKKLCDWEQEYGYNKKDYTEELFSVGSMSLENFHKYLDLSPEDKIRFKKDFPSLYMDPTETYR